MIHVLEHLGQTVDSFIGIMKELYRVCSPNALVKVTVPHPRHDCFIMDPTHVRPITGQVLNMFSKTLNQQWQKNGDANTPLGLIHDIDFELIDYQFVLAEPYQTRFRAGQISLERVNKMEKTLNNIVSEIKMVIKAVK